MKNLISNNEPFDSHQKKDLILLVIEDGLTLNKIIKETLLEKGFQVETAFSGNEGIEKAKKLKKALLILDYHLPDLNAKEILETLTQEKISHPFVIVTGYGNEKVAVEMMRLGARDYIIKDSKFVEILPHIIQRVSAEVLREKKYLITEQALKESERRFRLIFEDSPIGITLVDKNLKFCRVNHALYKMLGYSEKELITLTFPEVTHPEDIEKDIALCRKLFDGEIQDYKLQKRYIRKDQKVIHGNLTVSLIRDKNEQPLYAVGMVEDITEYSQAGEALQESEEKFRLILESAPYGILLVNSKGKIVLSNSQTEKLFGYQREELIGELFEKLIPTNPQKHPINNEETPQNPWIMKAGNLQQELIAVRKNGVKFLVEVHLNPLDTPDGLLISATIIDITERKHYENQIEKLNQDLEKRVQQRTAELENTNIALQKSEREAHLMKETAETANSAKSEFLAKMSHEIRTPMNAIIGIAHLLEQTEINSKQKDYLKKIEKASKNLLGIINDILDFSKIESGNLKIEQAQFNLEEILKNISDLVSIKAQEKGIELIFNVPADVPIHLIGDPLRIHQIMVNLADNAIKFTHSGEVVILVELLEAPTNNCKLQFSVRDTGIGLSKEKLSHLFQAFNQVDSSIARQYGGTGLGLAISKKLVEIMGGEIWVESNPGEGSVFSFILELGLCKPQEKQFIQPSFKGLKVLLVDDNTTTLEVQSYYLEGLQCEVKALESGEEAIKELIRAENSDEKPYQLMIIDWKMDGMDGLRELLQIEKEPEISSPPAIVMVTACSRGIFQKQLKETTRVKMILIKPVNRFILLEMLNTIFRPEDKRTPKTERCTNEFVSILNSHFLLVEDNAVNQLILSELIKNKGGKFTIANNGQEAVELLKETKSENKYDLVLMDLHMPKLDGYQATRLIRKIPELGYLPIIAITADAVAGVRQKCLAAGMDDYLSKPIQTSEFYATLHKWLPSKQKNETLELEKEQYKENSFLSLPGINIERILKEYKGDQKSIKELLAKSAKKTQVIFKKSQNTIKQNQFSDFIQQFQALQEAASEIYADSLSYELNELEKILNLGNSQKLNYQLKVVLRNVEEVFTSIEILEQKDPSEKVLKEKVIHFSKTKTLLEELKTLLENDDTKAIQALESFRGYIKKYNFQKEILQLENAIKNYDFERGLEILLTMATTLGVSFKKEGY